MPFWTNVVNKSGRGFHDHKPRNMEEINLATAEAHLAHEAKIQTLTDLIQADDYEQLAFDDRESVRQYKQQKMGINTTPEEGVYRRKQPGPKAKVDGLLSKWLGEKMGHILGDVHIEQPSQRQDLLSAVLPILLGSVLGAIGWGLLTDPVPPVDPPAPVVDGDTRTLVKPGFGVPRER